MEKDEGRERKEKKEGKEISMPPMMEPSRRIDLNSQREREGKKKKEEERGGRKDIEENKEKRKREVERKDGNRRSTMRRSSNSNTSKPSALISSQFRRLQTGTGIVVA